MDVSTLCLLVVFCVSVSLLALRTMRFASYNLLSFTGFALFTAAYVGIISTVISAVAQPELMRNLVIGLHLPLLIGAIAVSPRLAVRRRRL